MIGIMGKSKSPLISILAYCLMSMFCFMGCAKEKKKSIEGSSKVQTYFVKGDPMNLISGSAGEPSTPFGRDQIRETNNYLLTSIIQFTEREVAIPPNSNRDLEKENAPRDNESPSKAGRPEVSQTFNMIEKPNGVWSFESQDPGQLKFLLNSDTNGKFRIFALQLREKTLPVTPIHFSCSRNCEIMSFLARYDAEDSGSALVAFYWTKNEATLPVPIGTKLFNYIFGKGVKIPWNNKSPLPVKICGAQTRKIEKPIRQAIESWSQLLTDRLEIELETADTYPPFSDLNFHCIQIVENYLMEQNPEISKHAITIGTSNLITNQMQDSDIIIFAKELEKYEDFFNDIPGLVRTVRHEFGHFLTLGHQFETESIMSYNPEDIDCSLYDAMAIANLYPRTKPMKPKTEQFLSNKGDSNQQLQAVVSPPGSTETTTL